MFVILQTPHIKRDRRVRLFEIDRQFLEILKRIMGFMCALILLAFGCYSQFCFSQYFEVCGQTSQVDIEMTAVCVLQASCRSNKVRQCYTKSKGNCTVVDCIQFCKTFLGKSHDLMKQGPLLEVLLCPLWIAGM